MPNEFVIDTTVLQKANATLTKPPKERSLFKKRIRLLIDIQEGRRVVLYSKRLIAEYEKQIPIPRNDYVKAFFELLAHPNQGIPNWARWPSSDREKARKCRYPIEDDHVLRTAIRPNSTTIVTEEKRMLDADSCIYRRFKVHIRTIEPWK